MTNRPIDAQFLKEYIDNCSYCSICPDQFPNCEESCDIPECLTEKMEAIIDAQPTMLASERRAKIVTDAKGEIRCGRCYTLISYGFEFCPTCGSELN